MASEADPRAIATKLLGIADDYESMAASPEAIDKTKKHLEKKTRIAAPPSSDPVKPRVECATLLPAAR